MNNTKYEKIKYKNKYFVYDTSSNKIIQIDKNIYSFLDDYFKLKTKELKDKSKNYDELIKQINKLERQGFFMPLIKKDFSSKILDENFIEKKLKKGISKLVLEITQKCNLRCYYCKYSGSYEGERKHTNQSMKYEVSEKTIYYFLKHSADNNLSVSFFGGEPLLEMGLLKKNISYIKKKNKEIKIIIDTNLIKLNKKIIDYCIENNIFLQVSLNGPEEIHNRQRTFSNNGKTYKQVIENLEKIRKKDKKYFRNNIRFMCAYDRNEDIVKVFNYFNSAYFRYNKVSLTYISATDNINYKIKKNNLKKYEQGIKKIKKMYLESLKKQKNFRRDIFWNINRFQFIYSILAKRRIGSEQENNFPIKCCLPGFAKIFVSADGKFYPCEKVYCPSGEIGDYKNGLDRKKIISLIKIATDFCDKYCWNCSIYRLCHHCFMHFKKADYFDYKRKKSNCIKEKKFVRTGLKDFMEILLNEPGYCKNIDYTLKNRLYEKK